MPKKYLWPAAVIIIVGVAMFGFAPRSDCPEVGVALVVLVLLMGALATPAVRVLARNNNKRARAAGLISMGLAICALVAGLATSPPILSPEATAGVFSILFLLGLLLFQLPRASDNVESALDAQKVAARVRPTLGGFRSLEEVQGTYTYLWLNKASLARVTGPWLLAFCALPVLLFHPDFWNGVIGQDRGLALWLLAGLVVFILTEVCLVLVVSIQWTRFVATGREPRFPDFPGKALWGLLWRWLIFGAVFRATGEIEPWLKAHLPGASAWEVLALDKLCLLTILILASPFALGLPPIALNEPAKSTAARTLAFSLAGRKYYLGSALILTPFLVLFFIVDVLLTGVPASGLTAAVAICEVALTVGLMIVAMTYVTRVYVRGVAAAR